MTSATSPIILKWDPKSLEIRTLTVERLLEPLVTQTYNCLCLIFKIIYHVGFYKILVCEIME
uniref:Catenin alpha 2 n=1 Tax=Saimiri boliviensis boliviensis TaxID=39432 RepID=A0A2K6T5B0_SAIBB